MQRRLDVAEQRVIDTDRARHCEDRLPQSRHVRKERRLGRRRHRIQVRHDRVRQQEAVTRQHLRIAHHGPTRRKARDQRGIRAGAARIYAAVYGRAHRRNTK
jgi:hypothetical protein